MRSQIARFKHGGNRTLVTSKGVRHDTKPADLTLMVDPSATLIQTLQTATLVVNHRQDDRVS
jgi:hypothetical protein